MADTHARPVVRPGITPGVLDAAARQAFSSSASAGLALALHDHTGWPLIKVTDVASVHSADDHALPHTADTAARADTGNRAGSGPGGRHWLVLHPSGRLLDVDGLHAPAEIVKRFDGTERAAALGRTSRDDAWEEYFLARGEPVPLDVCGSFVDDVLDRAGG